MIRAFFGGSFDPVHAGHVAVARHILAAELADSVHLVPAWLSPHKDRTAASAEHRLAMIRLAFPVTADLVIDRREILSRRSCFTLETLTEIQAEYPGDRWRLVIGGDNLPGLNTWHRARELFAKAEILIFGRAGRDLSAPALMAVGLDPDRVQAVPEFDHPVSSSAVRAMLATEPMTTVPAAVARLTAAGLPAAVARYIVAHRLYRPDRNGETRVPDPD